MNNHSEKMALLLGKFDEGQISDSEISELSNLIDNSGDTFTNGIDSFLNNITPEINESHLDFMDNYLDTINSNFASVNNNLNGNSGNLGNVSNGINNLPTFSLNSSIVGIKLSTILSTLGILSIAGIAYFVINWNGNENQQNISLDSKSNIENTKTNNSITSNNNSSINTIEVSENNTNSIDINNNENKANSNVVLSNNENIAKNEVFTKEDKIIYSEEFVSLVNQNSSNINELIIKLKNDLTTATENDNKTLQSQILYKLGVIYRVKNISVAKSIELLDKAKEITLSSRVNLNLVQLSDIYGELYKSNKLLNNAVVADENLKYCIKFLNQAKSANIGNNKIISKLDYWKNEVHN